VNANKKECGGFMSLHQNAGQYIANKYRYFWKCVEVHVFGNDS